VAVPREREGRAVSSEEERLVDNQEVGISIFPLPTKTFFNHNPPFAGERDMTWYQRL
jgi:hypothetical protein